MRISTKPFEINVSVYLLPILAVFILTGYIFEYLAAFLSIVLHELGHVLVASRLGFGLRSVSLLPSGLSVSLDEAFCTRKDSIIICTAGPIVNLVLALASLLSGNMIVGCSEYLHFFSLSNFYLAVFNLIPAIPLDGGRILQEILSDRVGLISTGQSLRRLAAFLSALFLLLGLYQIFYSRINFTLFIIGFYIMLLLISGRTEAALMNMKQIIFRRSRILKKGT